MKKNFTRYAAGVSLLLAATSGVVVAAVDGPLRKPSLPSFFNVRKAPNERPATARPMVSRLAPAPSPSGAAPLYAGDGVTLYGDVIYSDAWEETSDYGVYSFSATATPRLTAASETGDYNFRANGGAVYKDGHFYMLRGDESSCTYYDYNTDSWEEENEDEVSPLWMATDFAVSPTDGKIYGAMADGRGGQVLGTVDFDGGRRTEIGSLSHNLCALAADAYGNLYGIGTDGGFYKVDAADATETFVGPTGVAPASLQSATIDLASGRLFWAATTTADVGALYEVDLATGRASRIATFPGNEQIVGLYSLSTAAAWEGPDAPAAPSDVTAAYADGIVTLSWTAPTEGIHKGEIDLSQTVYDVLRLPDSAVVASGLAATTLTDTPDADRLAAYYYEVTARNAVGEGGKAKSNTVVAGRAVTLPYYQPFDDATTFELLKAVDADGDGSTWVASAVSGNAIDAGAPFENTDDWLFTPSLDLRADRLYKLSYRVWCSLAGNYPFSMKAAYGASADPSAATSVIQEVRHIADPDVRELGGYFRPAADGIYHVGINVSGYDIQNVRMDSLLVEEGPMLAAPDSVTNLRAAADAGGAAIVELSFTAPVRTVGGDALDAISSVVVSRDGIAIDTLDGVQPGQAVSFTDRGASSDRFNRYEVRAVNNAGAGLAALTTVYVGIDLPTPPTAVRAQYNGEGSVLLSWNAPLTGVNGGYINPQSITYGVQRSAGGNVTLLAQNQTPTTLADNIDETGEQDYQYYGVAAHNACGYGEMAVSNMLITGAPYRLPFVETFDGGRRAHFWGATNEPEDGRASWGSGDDYHGNQYYAFNGSYRAGDASTLFTGKISLEGAVNPILEYDYFYRAEEGDDSLEVYVIKNGIDTVLVDDRGYTLYMHAKDFEKAVVPLAQFVGAGTRFVQVAFRVKTYSPDAMQLAAVDNVTVRDQREHDLMAADIHAPATARPGDTVSVVTTVRNYGSTTAAGYHVELTEGGEVVATMAGDPLAADSVAGYVFPIPVSTLKDSLVFGFNIVYDADEVPANNTSATAGVGVVMPVYPTPTSAGGTPDDGNGVSLTWTAPDYAAFTLPATEDVEGYQPFAVDSLGEWTVRDADGQPTRSDINVDWNELSYTHKGEPMAWMVMNPAKAGAPFTNWMDEPTGWQPVSGSQYFASISNAAGTNDDWLISPELNGEAQTVGFWQHGYYGMERYEVLYSTTDTARSSFRSLGEESSAAAWTHVSYDLPEGAKYFAIRNLGAEYSSYFFVDDITYLPASGKGALTLTGYNIYRDGVLIGHTDASTTTFTDSDARGESRDYQITAVYNLGESRGVTVEMGVSSIATVERDRTLGVTSAGGRITAAGMVAIHTLDGRLVFRGNATNGVAVSPGVYAVTTAGSTVKVIVR